MQTLIAIGFWNDGSDGCPWHNPQEFVDSRSDPSLRESLFHYLQSGTIANQYLGHSWCRFDCGIDESGMGSSERTDGVWLWPEGLAHYVARHEIRLPDEFIAHARSKGFTAPAVEIASDAVGDLGFWDAWCAKNTSGDPDAQAVWRRTADEIESADRAIIAKLIEKHGGLSEQCCSWEGCQERSLLGLAFCPACAHHKMNHWP